MAHLLRISPKGWQGYERGIHKPGFEVLESLAALGFNLNWIMTGEGSMELRKAPEIKLNQPSGIRDGGVFYDAGIQMPPISHGKDIQDLQPALDAAAEVLTSTDDDAKLALLQNVYAFQGRVRYKEEVDALKRKVAQLEADMDAIRRRLLEPREDDFKTQEAKGAKKQAGGEDGK